jgi:hypothetical protein
VHIRLVGVQFLTLTAFPGLPVRERQNFLPAGAGMGIGTSQNAVTAVTAGADRWPQNSGQEGSMPILFVALIALAAFGLIGVFLGAAVVLEQRKITGKEHHGKAA